MQRRTHPETSDSALPPPEFLKVRPHDPNEWFETPVDERGLVKIPDLLKLVKARVEPEYIWPKVLGVHHFYWYSDLYPWQNTNPNPKRFINLPIHKGIMPRQFENLLHALTYRPSVPPAETMQNRLEAWHVATGLFKMARKTIETERNDRKRRRDIEQGFIKLRPEFDGEDVIGQEILYEEFIKNFGGFEKFMTKNHQLPEDYRLIPYSESPEFVAKNLGKIVVPRALSYVNAIAA